MKKYILIFSFLLFVNSLYSQILYEETFENYPLGDFITDPTGATPGLGNWYVFLDKNTASEVKIEQEPTKGNVLVVKNAINYTAKQKDLEIVWNNRTTGNNVLFTEYEIYAGDSDNTIIFNLRTNSVIDIRFNVNYNSVLQLNETFIRTSHNNLIKTYQNLNFIKKWITIQVYIDYNTNKQYVHIPVFGITTHNVFTQTPTPISELALRGDGGILTKGVYTNSVAHKLDNIKITALNAVPPHVLSAESFLATKFNIYPNPATNVVNITNSENLLVNKVTIYDITGKQLSTQNFNNEANIQLNVAHLASGTYMLHLQTNEGTAVKKIVKK